MVRYDATLHRQSIHQMELPSKGKLESDICKYMGSVFRNMV